MNLQKALLGDVARFGCIEDHLRFVPPSRLCYHRANFVCENDLPVVMVDGFGACMDLYR